MKVLVSGFEGYLGHILLRQLMRANYKVLGFDSGLFSECYFEKVSLASGGKLLRKDLRQIQVSDLQGLDAVCHLAALSNDPLGELDPLLTDEINHRASVRLATMARQAGVKRFVFSSSCSLYGNQDQDWVDETVQPTPLTAYAKSKWEAEKGILELLDEDFCPVILRNATAYGFSLQHRLDLVVNDLVGWAYTQGKIALQSDGSPWRPLVHVEDIAQAFVKVLEAPLENVKAQTFNVGSTQENFQIYQIAEQVADGFPDCRIDIPQQQSELSRSYKVRFNKIGKYLPEFCPKWDLEKGISELSSAYSHHGLTYHQFAGSSFRRIQYLRKLLQDNVVSQQLYFS